MTPNPFVCLRTIFCPIYWFSSRGDRINGSLHIEEHWNTPIPGTYKHVPGRGWFLIHRDDGKEELEPPSRLVYCRILHRFLFESEVEQRCRWEFVKDGVNKVGGGDGGTKGKGKGKGKGKAFRFFLLDDLFTWVVAWDDKGRFIPGPYKKWYVDPDTGEMRRLKSVDSSAGVSRVSTFGTEKGV